MEATAFVSLQLKSDPLDSSLAIIASSYQATNHERHANHDRGWMHA